MSAPFDLVVRRARLRGKAALCDIAIQQARIAAISERVDAGAAAQIDARGGLVTESFVNPHLHLCKVYTLRMMDDEAARAYQGADMGKAMSAIELAARVKSTYDASWIIANVRRAVAAAAYYGTTHLRAFADVDGKARLEGIKALLRAREEFRDTVAIQVVAFAQDGIAREPGAAELMRQAMALGADVVGGIPWIEYTDADAAAHVDFCFDLAREHDANVSMLVDDAGDAGLRTLETMALAAIRRNWHGRVLAHHARAMALYPTPYLEKLSALMRQAGLGLVTDPHTGPLHARVKELLAAGVNVCLGQDDVSDAYYAFGRNNMLEVAFLAAHLLWMTTRPDMETLYDMITGRAAQAMGVENHTLAVGAPANFVVLDAPDLLEALREHAAPTAVVSQGRQVDQEKMRQLSRPDAELV
ncbi:MAG: amidohydrolase family protein [Candidatus Binatia bacterium]